MVPRPIKLLLVVGALVVTPVVLLRATGTAKLYRIPTSAMQPTLGVGSRFVALQRFADPAVGQVWTVRPPVGPSGARCGGERPPARRLCDRPSAPSDAVVTVDRIVAGPGDEVAMRRGRLLRNGRPDRFVCRGRRGCDFEGTVTVPDGHWYMLGDNRAAAEDSRYWGPVPTASLVGRALFVD